MRPKDNHYQWLNWIELIIWWRARQEKSINHFDRHWLVARAPEDEEREKDAQRESKSNVTPNSHVVSTHAAYTHSAISRQLLGSESLTTLPARWDPRTAKTQIRTTRKWGVRVKTHHRFLWIRGFFTCINSDFTSHIFHVRSTGTGVAACSSSSSLWLAPNPSKRWGELFFLLYTPFWLTLCLGIIVPYKLYEVIKLFFFPFSIYMCYI